MSMDRRSFVLLSSMVAAGGLKPEVRAASPSQSEPRPGLRTITYNVLVFHGFKKTDDNKQDRKSVV